MFKYSFHISLLLFVLFATQANAQEKYTLSGYVKDAQTGEYIPGVAVFNEQNRSEGIVTNIYGFYSLTLKSGSYTISFTSLGYAKKSVEINLKQNISLNVEIGTTVKEIKEVTVEGEKSDKNVKSSAMGTTNLSIDKIKNLPVFMGEVDPLKTIQLLPGIKSSGDGNSGFYVRGGGPDQNLILIDDATVYNASHLLGFFSVFNGDAIKDITMYKGGMPTQYGGRLASVLDVTMKDGNSKKYTVDGGIGVIASRITIQGPIKKDTSSFIISARRTYIDVLVNPFIDKFKKAAKYKGSGIFFYDLNAKINYRISDKNRLFVSGYFGRDKFTYKNTGSDFNVEMPWGNSTTSLRWNHLYNRKLFSNTSLIFSDFKFEFKAIQQDFEFKLFSGIRDWTLKQDFNYYPTIRHNIKFGVNYIYHTFTPFNASAKQGDVVFDTGKLARLYAHEAALYFSDDWDVTDWFKINAGARYSFFQQVGPFDRYVKNTIGQTIDTVHYNKLKKVVDYGGIEPRVSLRISLNQTSSIKASFTQNYQYIHLASLSAVSLPTDVWVPSTELIKPQFGTQYALGYFKNFHDNMYETSVEVYYKEMKNQLEYKEGSLPEDGVNDNSDYSFTQGKGHSYGAEFFIKKRLGKFNGWIGYTLSYTTRQFAELNSGKEFYAKFDRRHDGSLVLTYDLSNQWVFSTVFVYGTGNAITLPVSRYFISQRLVNEYGERNSVRMVPYHRLDLSVTFTPDKQKHLARKAERRAKKNKPVSKKTWYSDYQSSLNFSVFNVYNRHNPFFIYFDNEGNLSDNNLKITAKQVSLFPILPSITWNFKF